MTSWKKITQAQYECNHWYSGSDYPELVYVPRASDISVFRREAAFSEMSWDTRSWKIHVRVTLRSENWQVHGPLAIMSKSKSIFSRRFSDLPPNFRSFEPLFVCGLDLGMVENVCYITCTARFGQSSKCTGWPWILVAMIILFICSCGFPDG